ncbi:MAG: Spx/MgsR family RNA polymerase-binding regulatory protein [Candidatus Thioglobus sp.]
MIIMYGIHNCDNVRKAKKYLEKHGFDFEFVDFRKNPVNNVVLQAIIDIAGLDKIVNRRSTTYRNLNKDDKNEINIEILLSNPTLIKRPLLVKGSEMLVGFNEEEYINFL